MYIDETTYLLNNVDSRNVVNNGLSTFFAIICIIDVFGVFPVVTLPKAIIDCGLYGILVVVAVCCVQLYTATILGRCWLLAKKMYPSIHRKTRYPYAALTEITYGTGLSKFVTLLMDLTIFGGGIPNLIVASQNIQLLGQRISDNNVDITFCYWIIIVGTILCPILWLGSPKDMKVLCSLSVALVASVFFLTCGCLIMTSKQENASVVTTTSWGTVLKTYGIIAFQFDIHPSVLTIQVDMNDSSQLSKALIGGFGLSLTMFSVTAIITFLKYGYAIQPSILDTLPTSIPLHFASAFVAIQLCLTSAVSNSALYQQMEDCLSISREFNLKRCILRTILTMLAVVIAESVPKFDLVMSLIGGSLTAPLMFILPPLLYLKMSSLHRRQEDILTMESFTNIIFTKNDQDKNVSQFMEMKFREDLKSASDLSSSYLRSVFLKNIEIGLCLIIVITSCLLTVTTSYFNVTTALLSYSDITKPCIYNVSQALIYL